MGKDGRVCIVVIVLKCAFTRCGILPISAIQNDFNVLLLWCFIADKEVIDFRRCFLPAQVVNILRTKQIDRIKSDLVGLYSNWRHFNSANSIIVWKLCLAYIMKMCLALMNWRHVGSMISLDCSTWFRFRWIVMIMLRFLDYEPACSQDLSGFNRCIFCSIEFRLDEHFMHLQIEWERTRCTLYLFLLLSWVCDFASGFLPLHAPLLISHEISIYRFNKNRDRHRFFTLSFNRR